MKYINYILTIVVVAATIGLFFLLGPEAKTGLFYYNMIVCVVLEIMLGMSLEVMSRKKFYNVHTIAVVSKIFQFAVIAGVIMLVYNLFLSHLISVNWYFGAHILLFICYLVIILIMLQGISVQVAVNEEVKEVVAQQRSYSFKFSNIMPDFKEAVAGKPVDEKKAYNTRSALQNAVDRAMSVSPVALNKNPEFAENIISEFGRMGDEISHLGNTEDPAELDAALDKIRVKSDKITDQVKTFKGI